MTTTQVVPGQQPETLSHIVADTLDSVTALARFEFEPGRSNDGTKVLMVEWQDDNSTRASKGSWQISWTGKKTTLAAADNPSDSTNRLYFLLPPGSPIPPQITIAYEPAAEDASNPQVQGLEMKVNPLPAIFTPELGATAKAQGRRGVLHTIWGKKRLQVLEKEIAKEEQFNLEGIALEMARAEKKWIEQNFGIAQTSQRPPQLDLSSVPKGANPPLSPRSPGGRRLTDRLKGLSILTTDSVNTPTRETNPLSPEAGDVAYSSFSAIRGDRPSQPSSVAGGVRRIAPILPPSEVTEQQAESAAASLAAIAQGDHNVETKPSTKDEDLFAVALSPRSPDEPKSPFSIQTSDGTAANFARIKGISTQKTF